MIIMCIGDCHIPFQHKDSFAFIKAVKEQFNPDLVVCLGDLVDQYTISKYGKSTNSAAAVEELGATRKAIKELSSIIPEMTITLGNHTARYLKRIEEIGIPEEFMKSLNQIYEAPETWEWKEEHYIDSIRFWHGEPFSGKYAAYNMLNQYRINLVHGHLHSLAGVTYQNNGNQTNWVLSCGCLVDNAAYAFQYSKAHKDKPVLGIGLILNGVPVFIPMILNKKGSWIGTIL